MHATWGRILGHSQVLQKSRRSPVFASVLCGAATNVQAVRSGQFSRSNQSLDNSRPGKSTIYTLYIFIQFTTDIFDPHKMIDGGST